jgi:hypothetical protein
VRGCGRNKDDFHGGFGGNEVVDDPNVCDSPLNMNTKDLKMSKYISN